MKIQDCVKIMETVGWLVRKSSPDLILLVKMFNKRPIEIRLDRAENGKFHLTFPSYIFSSTISHFSPVESEYRFCRNKTLLMPLVRNLGRTGLWKFLNNPYIIKVNGGHPKADKKKLSEDLEDLYSFKVLERKTNG